MNAVPQGAVVVGVAGDSGDLPVLTAAFAAAKSRSAPVHLIHASEALGSSMLGPLEGFTWEAIGDLDRSAEVLAVARKTLAALDETWPVTEAGSIGRAENALVEASESAALVVVGTRRKGRLEELMLGAVALNVAAHASCPVLVVPPGADPDGDGAVVVGVDGSDHSRAAAREAVAEARRRTAPLIVVTTWHLEVIDGYVVTEPDSPEWQQVEDRLRALQEQTLDGLDVAGLEVEHRVVKGGPRSALVDASSGAAVVVVGNRGRGGFRSKALGSVTMDLLKRSQSPVLVVHAPR